MNTLAVEYDPLATHVVVTDAMLKVLLADGREVAVPLAWFPRLQSATHDQRQEWRFIGGGIGIHWQAVDEDISVASLLAQ
jgi:hypothetical protein